MDIRQPSHPQDVKNYTTQRLRDEFLITGLFEAGSIKRVYSHIDRIIVMGFCPVEKPLELGEGLDIMKNLGTGYFLERRELGVINVGGAGKITAGGETYRLENLDGLYVGMGAKSVVFESLETGCPAKFYTLSAPAHASYSNVHIDITKAKKVNAGDSGSANLRVINQYIHPDLMESCQLSMGMTELKEGSVWNTMPCHTHERRMEVYFYFDMKEGSAVFHYMGEPCETRHIVMHNEEAVISPSWSIHSGCGTAAYKFIWGMVGENKTFTDMDNVAISDLR